MPYLLFLTLPAALWLLFRFPYEEAARDKAAIDANGSLNSLHEAFHAGRAWRRGALVGVFAWLGALPLVVRGLWPAVLLFGSLEVLGLVWLFYTFNTTLSRLRGLDPYYLSADKHAAYLPDRLLTKLGWGLRPFLHALLLAGTAAALLLAGGAWWAF